jgi:hypothetical protein
MNPAYVGDSYDLVKRFFSQELGVLGYEVLVEPLFTGEWSDLEASFFRLIGAKHIRDPLTPNARRALLIDPDTGINAKGGAKHVSFNRIAKAAQEYDLVFVFDQSFSRQQAPRTVMAEKLAELTKIGLHAMYYDSHARFAFASRNGAAVDELHRHLLGIGLPESRLILANS